MLESPSYNRLGICKKFASGGIGNFLLLHITTLRSATNSISIPVQSKNNMPIDGAGALAIGRGVGVGVGKGKGVIVGTGVAGVVGDGV
jgi:hypothetical protein